MRKFLTLLLLVCISTIIKADEKPFIYQLSVNDGISSQYIHAMDRDMYGRLWVGTSIGLDIFNNGAATSITSLIIDGYSHTTGEIKGIYCGEESTLLITNHEILDYKYDTQDAISIRYNNKHISAEHVSLQNDLAYFFDNNSLTLFRYILSERRIEAIYTATTPLKVDKVISSNENLNVLLLADNKRGIFRYNMEKENLSHIRKIGTDINAAATYLDKDGILWVQSVDNGLIGYNTAAGYDIAYHFPTDNNILTKDMYINNIAQLPGNELMICTNGYGLLILNKERNEIRHSIFMGYPPLNDVQCVIANRERKEILYATSSHGIIQTMSSFIHHVQRTSSTSKISNYITAICTFIDNEHDLWFGTSDHGLIRFDEESDCAYYVPSTSNMSISSICQIDNNRLCIIDEERGGFILDKRSESLVPYSDEHFTFPQNRSYRTIHLFSNADFNIFALNVGGSHYFIGKDSVPVAIDLKHNYAINNNVNMLDDYTIVVNDSGLFRVDHQTLEVEQMVSLKSYGINGIICTKIDSHGNIWLLNPDKLYRYDPTNGAVATELSADVPGYFSSMSIDLNERIWIACSENRIICYDPIDYTCQVYSKDYGVVSGEFHRNFAITSKEGRIFFPNASGLLIVDTDSVVQHHNHDNIRCTSIKKDGIYIDNIQTSLDGNIVPISIPNDFNTLSLSFCLNSFTPNSATPIRYILKRENHTIYTEQSYNTTLNLTKLGYGRYYLYTQHLCTDGWTDLSLTLPFVVSRPFINSAAAFIVLILFFIVFGMTIAKISINIKQMGTDRLLKMQENMHKDEKITLMTNIAHELKTPLSLMYNPVKDLLEEKAVKNLDYERLERIFNQINKMSSLVDAILDTSRNDVSSANIEIKSTSLNRWLQELLQDFEIDCHGKGLRLIFHPDNSIDEVDIDKKSVEVAVNNLVTNAIKYSESGTITVTTQMNDTSIIISVKDEGRGFYCSPETLFQRYFRERENDNIKGYGLGLAHARLLIRMLGGDIKAYKNSTKGSTFTIVIPRILDESLYKKSAKIENRVTEQTVGSADSQSDTSTPTSASVSKQLIDETDFDTKHMSLLIVDDQEDILAFIQREYKTLFKNIYTAHDGKEALAITKSKLPNIVVSDIMMPKMTGFELCQKIKTDVQLSHIPVILLTSRTDPKNQDIGYKMGADSFIPKPFDAKALYKIIRSQLRNRYEIRRQYVSSFFSVISEDQTFSIADEEFIKKLNKFIKDNLSDANLNVDMITQHMNVSRTTLFNKMSNLIGASANKYIRRIRMEEAKRLLTNTDLPIGEIAMKTGFSESQYFSTVFKQETGLTPSQFKEQHYSHLI